MGGARTGSAESRQAAPSRPKKFVGNPLQYPLRLRPSEGMSANPLQGIQVINSVNPCSSTPLHRPIYPLPLPKEVPRPPRIPVVPILQRYQHYPLSLSRRSSSLHLPHLHPPGIQIHLSQARLTLRRDFRKKQKTAITKTFLTHLSPFVAPLCFLLIPSQFLTPSRRFVFFSLPNLPAVPLFSSFSLLILFFFVFFFSISHSLVQVLPRSFPSAVSRSSSAHRALLLGLKL